LTQLKAILLGVQKIPVHVDKYGNFSLEEENIEEFIYTQLKRKDNKIRSFELMDGY